MRDTVRRWGSEDCIANCELAHNLLKGLPPVDRRIQRLRNQVSDLLRRIKMDLALRDVPIPFLPALNEFFDPAPLCFQPCPVRIVDMTSAPFANSP
jgi:hypothetical protein